MNLKIEMVLPELTTGGMEMMAADLGRILTGRGHRVGFTCIIKEGDLALALREKGFPVSVVPSPGVLPNFFPSRALRDHFADRKPHVVHAHDGVWGKAAMAGRAAGATAVVLTAHGLVSADESRFGTNLRRWSAQSADAVVAVSEPLADYLSAARIPAPRIHTILNGIDLQRFSPGPRTGVLRDRFSIPGEATLIGCVARLDPIKNPLLLLAVARQIQNLSPEIHFVFVGDGPMRAQIEAEITRSNLRKRVHLAGRVTDTTHVYRDLDVFVLPSHSEGTSISVLEAMATGLPIVATRVGGTPRLLGEPPCGVLVPSDDPRALSVALETMATDKVIAQRFGQAARARAVAEFDLERTVDRYEELYVRVLSGRECRDGRKESATRLVTRTTLSYLAATAGWRRSRKFVSQNSPKRGA